jgi:hypothetical protein
MGALRLRLVMVIACSVLAVIRCVVDKYERKLGRATVWLSTAALVLGIMMDDKKTVETDNEIAFDAFLVSLLVR